MSPNHSSVPQFELDEHELTDIVSVFSVFCPMLSIAFIVIVCVPLMYVDIGVE